MEVKFRSSVATLSGLVFQEDYFGSGECNDEKNYKFSFPLGKGCSNICGTNLPIMATYITA